MWGRAVVAGLAAAMILTTAACGQDAPMIMPMSEFQLEMRAALLKADPTLRIELVGEDSLKIHQAKAAKDDEGMSLFLDNAYGRYRNAPGDLDKIVGQLARVMASSGEKAALERDKLVVLIRPVEYLQAMPGAELVYKPLVGDFIEVVAVDESESFRLATKDDLAKAGIETAEAWAAARKNTGEKIGPIEVQSMEPGVWFVTDGASLALNLVSMPERWAAQGIEIKDEAAVVFLQRNVLLIADTADPARLSRFVKFVKANEGEPEVFSTSVFLYRHGNWSVLEPSK
ncbi:hypothetical protein [Caulobacter sp. D4A]|uniref:hypothetical protein n=1 Tax=Caulobacter sp. D4A TaxID=2204171 RepID=UPI0011B71B07|nr:hypothetical protein [Caulobacter sp. D4A]